MKPKTLFLVVKVAILVMATAALTHTGQRKIAGGGHASPPALPGAATAMPHAAYRIESASLPDLSRSTEQKAVLQP